MRTPCSLCIFILFSLSACSLFSGSDLPSTPHFDKSLFLSKKFVKQGERNVYEPASLSTYEGDKGEIVKTLAFEVADAAEANELLNTRAIQIRRLFETQLMPYGGVITKSAGCLKKIDLRRQAKEAENENSLRMDLYATDKFVYGTCLEAEEIYKSQYLLLYCKKIKTLFEVRVFYPKGNPTIPYEVASCT